MIDSRPTAHVPLEPMLTRRLEPMSSLLERISITPDVLHGRPRVRGSRIGVSMVLELLAAGHTPQAICTEFYPDITVEDVKACIAFANQFLTGEDIHFFEELRRSS
jgi:uncharacterized protein (DUF433 family)